jgi:hypothetical protein
MSTNHNNGERIMSTITTKAKFNFGVLLATPGASEAFERNKQMPFEFLMRHVSGDWGSDLCDEDRMLNDQALIDGGRLLSAYKLADSTKIWCITEAVGENGRRQSTTFLLPEEY